MQYETPFFHTDLDHCPRCSGAIKPIQVVKDPRVIHTICEDLGLPTAQPPVAPARAPPQERFPFDTDDAFGDDI